MITSRNNEKLKELRKLHDRKHRERSKQFLAEGEDMLAEASRWGARPKAVFFDPEALAADAPVLRALPEEVEQVAVEGDVLRASGSLGSGSRVIGVWEQSKLRTAEDPIAGESAIGIYLHEVADPGNVGAVVRAALALVAGVVVISPGTADPFSPKAIRASMGAIFGQPITRASFDELRERAPGSRLIALAPRGGKALGEAALDSPLVFCLGSERSGLAGEIVSGCDEVCHIPMRAGGAESLNVAMAATICLYEATKGLPIGTSPKYSSADG
jgi:TrmH family RNA methyltransferase